MKTIKEITNLFPFLSSATIKKELKYNSYKTERGFINHLAKMNTTNQEKAERSNLKALTIEIEWRRSMWGFTPHATYWAAFENNDYSCGENITASGCGYDKQSTVIAEIFNKVATGMIWRKRKTRKAVPYGIRLKGVSFPYFEGGIGSECYYDIAKFLGGKMEHVADAKMYDKFVFYFK